MIRSLDVPPIPSGSGDRAAEKTLKGKTTWAGVRGLEVLYPLKRLCDIWTGSSFLVKPKPPTAVCTLKIHGVGH